MNLCPECEWNLCPPGRRKCHKCRSRIYREKFPVRAVFYDLRHSAKRRGIKFTLDLPWFEKWIGKTQYMEKRGRGPHDLTIDRIREEGGYTKKNIQVLQKTDNSAKFHEHYKDKRRNMRDWSVQPCPF